MTTHPHPSKASDDWWHLRNNGTHYKTNMFCCCAIALRVRCDGKLSCPTNAHICVTPPSKISIVIRFHTKRSRIFLSVHLFLARPLPRPATQARTSGGSWLMETAPPPACTGTRTVSPSLKSTRPVPPTIKNEFLDSTPLYPTQPTVLTRPTEWCVDHGIAASGKRFPR